jgi:hypothetical protein
MNKSLADLLLYVFILKLPKRSFNVFKEDQLIILFSRFLSGYP